MTAQEYQIRSDVKFPHGERIDVAREVAACDDPWFSQTLTQVNDRVVHLGSSSAAAAASMTPLSSALRKA